MAKKYIRSFLYLGIIILIFFVHDFVNVFIMKGKYKRIISLADRFPSYLSDSIYKYYYGVSKIMMNEYDDGER